MINVKIIADSVAKNKRLTTFEITCPSFLVQFLSANLDFSITTAKQVISSDGDDLVVPNWGSYNKDALKLEAIWMRTAKQVAKAALDLAEAGASGSDISRLLEPYQHAKVLLTTAVATPWISVMHQDPVVPELGELANLMAGALYLSTPKPLVVGEWHLPYIDTPIMAACCVESIRLNKIASEDMTTGLDVAKAVSAAYCLDVAYESRKVDIQALLRKFMKTSREIVSEVWTDITFKHQATPYVSGASTGMYKGWTKLEVSN